MSEKPPKQMKGFGRKLLSRRRHFSYHAWPSGKGIKSGISPLGLTTSDSDAMAMPTFQTVNFANSEGGLPPPSPPATDASHTDCVRKRMTVLFFISDRNNYCLFYLGIN